MKDDRQPLNYLDKDLDLLGFLRRLETFNLSSTSSAYAISTEHGTDYVRNILTNSLSNTYENIRNVNIATDALSNRISSAKRLVCEKTGGIILDEDDLLHPFFKRKGQYTQFYGYPASRGALYYQFSNAFVETDECLMNMHDAFEHLRKNTNILSDNTSKQQKLAYVDYLKSVVSVLYHGLTYRERMHVRTDIGYKQNKIELSNLLKEIVVFYYRLLLDYTVDIETFGLHLERSRDLIDGSISYLRADAKFEILWFKYSELDDPIIILRAAKSFLDESQDIDVIIGIESGGTELCFVTGLLYALLTKKSSVESRLVTLSRYTLQKSILYGNPIDDVNDNIKNQVLDCDLSKKHILVVDDNANTGESAQIIYEALRAYTENIRIRVAEFDMNRSIFKHLEWDNPPEYIANPDIFKCSVGVTPITQGVDGYLPFKQQRKIIRQSILRDFYSQSLKDTQTPQAQDTPRIDGVKICAVHNSIDLMNAWNSGVQWFGIHCTYTDSTYENKISNKSRSQQIEYIINSDFVIGRGTGLPLAEIGSIKDMLQTATENKIAPRFVFLIDGHNINTLPAIIKYILPQGYADRIYFQLQNIYSADIVKRTKDLANRLYDHGVGIIQTFGSKEDPAIIKHINNDANIDYILLDYSQFGGSGRQIQLPLLRALLPQIKKPHFIAGGINAQTIGQMTASIGDLSDHFMIDVESSTELAKEAQTEGLNTNLHLVTVRKSKSQLADITDAWSRALNELELAREYEHLALENTVFKDDLNKHWRLSYAQYGSFAVTPTIENFLRQILYRNPSKAEIEGSIDALLNYRYLPKYYLQKCNQKMTYKRAERIPWVISNTDKFATTVSHQIKENGLKFAIWTAGESKNSPKINVSRTDEQYKKFSASGLELLFTSASLREGRDYDFIALPNKVEALSEYLLSLQHPTQLIILDDRIDNLKRAKRIAESLNINNITCILIGRAISKNDGYLTYESASEALSSLAISPNALLLCDMDGVLLHEEFRNEHQPKNLFLYLREVGLLDSEMLNNYTMQVGVQVAESPAEQHQKPPD